MRGVLRAGLGLAIAAVLAAVIPSSAAKGSNGLGPPPKACAGAVVNFCTFQSGAGTFSLSPHVVKVGQTITATFSAPGNLARMYPNLGDDAINWALSPTGLGEPQHCKQGPIEVGGGGKVSCKFKVTAATGGWVVVDMDFHAPVGGAISRDYYAALPAPVTPPPPKKPPKTPPVQVTTGDLAVTLSTDPQTVALTVDDKAEIAPKTVQVWVSVKNPTAKRIDGVTLVSLFPQPVDPTPPPDQLAFDQKLLPVPIGSLAPGASFKRAFPLKVTGDGSYRVRALVTYAESPTSPTKKATGIGGDFEVTVPPLFFEATVSDKGLESPSDTLVKAGNTVLITGKVRNLSSVRTLCLAPLLPDRAGNAGGTGPADIARYKADEIAPPVAGVLEPHQDILFGLWVHTSPDLGTRGTVRLDPKAGMIDAGGDCLATGSLTSPLKPAEIHVTPGSTEFTIHIDTREPQFSATAGEIAAEFFGGLTAGFARGSYDFFSSTCAGVLELLNPENLIRSATDPFGIYRGFGEMIQAATTIRHYWETATADEKQHFYSQIWSVLAHAGKDTWGSVRAKIGSIVDPWLTNIANASAHGDYKAVAHALGDTTGNLTAEVVLNVATAELGTEVFQQLSTLSKAFAGIGDVSRTYRTLKELPAGKLVNLTELKNLFGLARKDIEEIGAVARKYDVRIGVKGRSAESIAELDRGAVWKPEPVKPKNVNDIDRDWLGFRSRKGIVATKEFSPAEREQILKRVANSNLDNEQKQAILDRFAQRLQEQRSDLPDLQRYAKQKRINVGKNYEDNGFTAATPRPKPEYRAFKLNEVAGPAGSTEYVPEMWNLEKEAFGNITGDVDGLYLLDAGGGPLSEAKHAAILEELWKIGWQHPETLTWIKSGEFEFAKKAKLLGNHAPGGEAALEIGPDGVGRAVYIDLDQSLLFGPRGLWLDTVGGYVRPFGGVR